MSRNMSTGGDGHEVRVCAVTDLAVNGAKRFDVDGHRLAVVRFEDAVHVIGDQCSHADFSLAEGEVDANDCSIECWKHGSAFSVISGEPQTLPATKPVPVYDAVVRDEQIFVTLPAST